LSEVKEYSLDHLKGLVSARDVEALKAYMIEYDLIFKDGHILPANKQYYMDQYEYWDMQQLIAKIKLNSLYGCILNEGSRWFDPRIGQSVTLTGRCIVRHMMGKINELVTGDYNHLGPAMIYGDTDSAYFSVYNAWTKATPKTNVISSEEQLGEIFGKFHKATESGDDNAIIAVLKELTAEQTDVLQMALSEDEIRECGEDADIEAWENEFTAKLEKAFPPIVETVTTLGDGGTGVFGGKFGGMAPTFDWTDKDAIIKLYDDIADVTNESFPEFMDRTFNTGLERGAIIAAGREIVAENAMYIKKKRYAALVIDNEGKRYDVDGKPGKLKAMGLETKRSDTPAFVQDFLEEVLIKVLKGIPEDEVIDYVRDFREKFQARPGWQKGRPTAIKGLTKYGNKLEELEVDDINFEDDEDCEIDIKTGKVNMPGHVRAAINFNNMLEIMTDHATPPIKDGDKVVVCQLKSNPYGIESIARPVDVPEHNLPDWFKKMPFDHEKMENSMIDVKIDNLIGILQWDLSRISNNTTFEDMFVVAKNAQSVIAAGTKSAGSRKKPKVELDTDLFSF
jgi:hypothetical protein